MGNDDHVGDSTQQSAAAVFFAKHPQLRERGLASPAFRQWREQYKSLNIDGRELYIRRGKPMEQGGDTMTDEDELLLEWARQQRHATSVPAPPPEAQSINQIYESEHR